MLRSLKEFFISEESLGKTPCYSWRKRKGAIKFDGRRRGVASELALD